MPRGEDLHVAMHLVKDNPITYTTSQSDLWWREMYVTLLYVLLCVAVVGLIFGLISMLLGGGEALEE